MEKLIKKVLGNEKALTLIELLGVIVILGIIAAIAIPSIGGMIQKSREDAVKSDALKVLRTAQAYIVSNDFKDHDEDIKITKKQLKPYVELESLNLELKEVIYNGETYAIEGFGVAGKKIITFNRATIKDIQSKHSSKVTIAVNPSRTSENNERTYKQ
ncbi:prepilin-type N-terminal cleavage/methylation domain-containing protein [Bacillus sp. 1780r2a1]|uniref:prepilin-type N-terminal cleavage/methylation domain-containing protein n=1 Tax=Priestia TaxID=2800373 RepID=UPI00211AEC7B|nr:prepilin-type N-terminal cleavage/methylation domain-containing protein [Priestia flexa]MDT2045308.1 prepilin-type N-terminal cleavage/methylation domain-containing protein [Priestia flexa]USY57221.1 prepilin-type N-terminal cleavage/methylation domain-containing protein [Bacillus sp. 1780r2a1]